MFYQSPMTASGTQTAAITSGPGPSRRWLLALIASSAMGGCLSATEVAQDQLVRSRYEHDIHPLIETYCSSCHDSAKHKGAVDFSTCTTGREAVAEQELWDKALDQLTTQAMPPDSATRQPSDEERRSLRAWMVAARRLRTPDPGPSVIRRLSRAEYDRTVRDLLGADVAAGAELPSDSAGEGFDNAVSPLLMEKYLLTADAVLDRLIMPEQMTRHCIAGQMAAMTAGVSDPGTPTGTQRRFSGPGEVAAIVGIPCDGTYTLHIRAAAEQAGSEPVRLGVRFDSRVVSELRITAKPKYPSTYSCTTQLVAGRTRLSLVFMNPLIADGAPVKPAPATSDPASKAKAAAPPAPPASATPMAEADASATPAATRALIIDTIDISGPPAKTPTEAQRRLFIATPGAQPARGKEPVAEVSKHEAARAIIAPLAYRAYRRAPYAEEIDGLLRVFDLADAQEEDFTASVKLMLKAVLVSPQFLFRTPDDHDSTDADIVAISDHELASRLSYFLWGTMPDAELFQLARTGQLHDTAVRDAQVKRLIMDPRSRALSEGFAAAWLGVDHLDTAVVDEKKYPLMTREMRAAMHEEVLAFVEGLMRGGGSVLDLLDCDYAYMNTLTAKLYGMDGITGMAMQKVMLTDRNRGSLIAMPAVLLATSRADRTSPVKRGKWVLETLLGAGPPPPPPDVAGLDKQDTPEHAHLTLRQKTEQHRTDPACAVCHQVMDPIGFGLENFDAIGRWRTQDDTGGMVDAHGELPGRHRFNSPADLKRILMARKDEFVHVLCGKLLAFALGRHLTGYDAVVVDDLASAVAQDGYRFDAAIARCASSYPFLNRRALHTH
jgi:cytochrome c5